MTKNRLRPKIDTWKQGAFQGFIETHTLGIIYVKAEHFNMHPAMYHNLYFEMFLKNEYSILEHNGEEYKLFILN